MRRSTRAAALAMLLTAGSASAKDDNLVVNGGFEKGLDGWTLSEVTNGFEVVVESKERTAGRSAAHIMKPSAKRMLADRLDFRLKSVPAGKTLVVSAKVKGKALENLFLKLFVYDAKDELVLEDANIGRFTGTFDWREARQTFELPKEAVRAEFRVCMFLGGEAWIDEVSVTEAAAATAPAKKEPVAPLPADVQAWLDANAVRVKSLDAKEPFDDLAPLKETLKDARIVQLGESTHGDLATFAAKARLVRFLHREMGFEVLAFESGLFECDRANALLAKGDAQAALEGSVFGIWNQAPVRALFAEMAAGADGTSPLLLAGFDCRRSGGLANTFVDALDGFLSAVKRPGAEDLAAVAKLDATLGDDDSPSKTDLEAGLAAHARLTRLLDENAKQLAAKHGEAEVAFFSRCLANWKANEGFERAKRDRGGDRFATGNLRDVQMASNLRWLAETRHAGKKIVTWAATFHLARGLAGVSLRSNGRHYEGCVNMGEATHQSFGLSCYTIGFAAHGGETGTFGNRSPLPKPAAGSVEDLLHRYGAPFLFVDLRREGPFAKPLRMAPMSYDRTMEAVWSDVLDGVFFIDEMTAAR